MAIGGNNPPGAAQPTVGVVCALAITMLAATLPWADETPATKTDPLVGGDPDNNGINPYSKLSNEQLGSLAGTFEDLDRDQRRWFLTEVRKRMSAKGARPEIRVDKDDRFGRVARRVGRASQRSRDDPGPVGSSATPEERVESAKVYGTGVRSQREEPPDGSTSTLQSEDPPKPNR